MSGLPYRHEIRFAGTGGQGLILAATVLGAAFGGIGRHVAQSQGYEPTSRGGFCHADLVVADAPVDYPLATRLDALVLLDQNAVARSVPLLVEGALVLADLRLVPDPPVGPYVLHELALTRTALDLGSERIANVVALGAWAALAGSLPVAVLEQALLAQSPAAFRDLNLAAFSAGRKLAGSGTPAVAQLHAAPVL
ncbi:MAG: 2-oxoacid:acceptor oxidoreductase family protein [Gammaproteobacteria bacterium]|nr:2-oxoacid:acceptor oxidoreductase family protein [Gammaproteobacteria bacterium]